MGISFVCEDSVDKQLDEYIEKENKLIGTTINVKIFCVSSIEYLEKLKKDRSKKKIIITKNVTPDFISKALNITDNIVYRGEDCENIMEKIKKIIKVG